MQPLQLQPSFAFASATSASATSASSSTPLQCAICHRTRDRGAYFPFYQPDNRKPTNSTQSLQKQQQQLYAAVCEHDVCQPCLLQHWLLATTVQDFCCPISNCRVMYPQPVVENIVLSYNPLLATDISMATASGDGGNVLTIAVTQEQKAAKAVLYQYENADVEAVLPLMSAHGVRFTSLMVTDKHVGEPLHVDIVDEVMSHLGSLVISPATHAIDGDASSVVPLHPSHLHTMSLCFALMRGDLFLPLPHSMQVQLPALTNRCHSFDAVCAALPASLPYQRINNSLLVDRSQLLTAIVWLLADPRHRILVSDGAVPFLVIRTAYTHKIAYACLSLAGAVSWFYGTDDCVDWCLRQDIAATFTVYGLELGPDFLPQWFSLANPAAKPASTTGSTSQLLRPHTVPSIGSAAAGAAAATSATVAASPSTLSSSSSSSLSSWKQVQARGQAPSSRQLHSASTLPSQTQLLILFGRGLRGPLEDAWLFDSATHDSWTPLQVLGDMIPARYGHSCCCVELSGQLFVVIYGGSNGKVVYDDMVVGQLNTASFELVLRRLDVRNFWVPAARSGHSMCLLPTTGSSGTDVTIRLLIVGGHDARSFRKDTIVADIHTDFTVQYTKVPCSRSSSSKQLLARSFACLAPLLSSSDRLPYTGTPPTSDHIVLVGGTPHSNPMLYSISQSSWSALQTDSGSLSLLSFYGAGCVPIADGLLLVGGIQDNTAASATGLPDLKIRSSLVVAEVRATGRMAAKVIEPKLSTHCAFGTLSLLRSSAQQLSLLFFGGISASVSPQALLHQYWFPHDLFHQSFGSLKSSHDALATVSRQPLVFPLLSAQSSSQPNTPSKSIDVPMMDEEGDAAVDQADDQELQSGYRARDDVAMLDDASSQEPVPASSRRAAARRPTARAGAGAGAGGARPRLDVSTANRFIFHSLFEVPQDQKAQKG